ncbi:EAL domain-containing protein, partial [Vibrio sp. V18_P1S4T112]|uniref:EAL domain-containing protein n=1 Tax=Vibrio sp. V18_P1S4T112 TaxID=1938671 RepID=UPI000B9EEDE1
LYRSIFKEQVAIFSALPGLFFINIPIELLMTVGFASQLTHGKDNLNIEIQNPIKLFGLNSYEIAQVKREIQLLQKNGVKVWLDDIDDRFIQYAIELGVYGVKIDKNVVWSDYNLIKIKSELKNTNIKILAEGIENIFHFSKIISSGVDMAQGFLWPEIQVNSEGKIL